MQGPYYPRSRVRGRRSASAGASRRGSCPIEHFALDFHIKSLHIGPIVLFAVFCLHQTIVLFKQIAIDLQMKRVHRDTLLCCLVLFFAELHLAVGSAGIDIKFPDFPEDDDLIVYGDVEYNPAHRSHILNAHTRKQTTGSCGGLILKQGVHLQEVAIGRVASFRTSFSFSFTTYGEPWDARENPTSGTGLAFVIFGNMWNTLPKQSSDSNVGYLESCIATRKDSRIFSHGGFGLILNAEYAPYRGVLSNNYIQIMKNYDYEVGNPAYSHNLCGGNRTHCSYFSNGKVFTVWVDFTSSSKLLEVRLANGSQPNVTKPLQPLLRIPNYNLAKELGDEVHLSFWGGSGVNHFEEHELLSWRFLSRGISEPTYPSFIRLLQFSKSRTDVGIMIGVLGSVATLVLLWTISLFSRSFRDLYGYTSIRDPATGPHVFSYAELRKATSNFDESNLLGTGGSGSVHRGTLEGGNWIAVKQINFSESEQAKAVFQAEVSSLGQIRHRNVVRLQGSCQEKGRLLLVYDYLPNGSLDAWLHKKSDRLQQHLLSLEIRHSILEGVGAALEYLHEDCLKCILHRDIKSSNVLLDADFKAQLGDFGLARLMDHHKPDKTTLAAGTLGYMAPEILYTGKATKESDVFSFGILVLEVVCGRRPLDMQTMNPKDLVLLYTVWQAHEVGALLSVVDSRLFDPLSSSSLDSPGVSPNIVVSSTIIDVDIEVQKLTAINLLRLGLLCCLPNPKARPPMAQVNGILQEIGHIMKNLSTVTSISMPSLPSTKPLGLYHSLEFSQVAVLSDSSAPPSEP